MQHRKCCYCEAYIPEEGHLKAVEHFRPQSVYRNLMNDWPNLLLACAQCNGKKSDKFPTELADGTKVVRSKPGRRARPLLIDPSNDRVDPEDHLDFAVDIKNESEILGLIRPKNDSKRGEATIRTTGLADSFHTMRHKNHIRAWLWDLLVMDQAKERGDQTQLEQFRQKFRSTLSAANEFAAIARAFAREYQLVNRFRVEISASWNAA